jgi:glycosyltransferase involved in cell wall biosynthesis
MMGERICIVTEEFSGLNPSGGIGAAARGLALFLASLGCEVEVLLTDLSLSIEMLQRFKRENSIININSLSDQNILSTRIEIPVDTISKSYAVYEYAKTKSYSCIHFNDWIGSGFYTAMARRQGLIDATIVSHLHGNSEWVRRHNRHIPNLDALETEAIERSQIENSDFVFAPSEYLLDWCRRAGWKLPPGGKLNWILPQWVEAGHVPTDGPLTTRAITPGQVRRLIFFGRQERRKGIEIFVEAIRRLPPHIQPDLVFLGRFDRVDGEFTGSHILRMLRDYGGTISFRHDLDQVRAMGFIERSTDALCVMPSLIENSPCTVGECLTLRVPFLTTAVGGTPELLDAESRAHCLVAPSAAPLAEAIERIMTSGVPPLVSTLVPDEIFGSWAGAHAKILSDHTRSAMATSPGTTRDAPLVSVCLTHFDRPLHLKRALARLEAQTYPNFEIVIVDDGSRQKASLAALDEIEATPHAVPIRVVRTDNKYLGAARNTAVSHSTGEYILFHDDDNISEPSEIEQFVASALISNADILTCQAFVFSEMADEGPSSPGKILYYPIGIGGLFSFFRNRFGDANALVKRTVFDQIGGFTELRDVGWEDWEFFLRAHLLGCSMGVVPEPLFHYRANPNGMLASGDLGRNYERLYDMIDELRPRLGSEIFRCAQAEGLESAIIERTRSRLAQEIEGATHLRLMNEDPNAPETRALLSDLAFGLGRIADAIDLGIGDHVQREKLMGLLASLQAPRTITARHDTIRTVEPTTEGTGYLLKGWLYDRAKHRTADMADLTIGGVAFRCSAARRFDRPDVQAALGLTDPTDLGLVSLLEVCKESRFSLKRYFAKTSRIAAHRRSGIASPLLFTDNRSTLVGHIDEATPIHFVSLALPPRTEWSCVIQLHSSSAVEGVVLTENDAHWSHPIDRHTTRIDLTSAVDLETRSVRLALPIAARVDLLLLG